MVIQVVPARQHLRHQPIGAIAVPTKTFSYRVLLIAVVLGYFVAAPVEAQTAPDQSPFGISFNGYYQSYDVDTVNVENGNVIVKIPLYSLPQLGKLALSFSAVSN